MTITLNTDTHQIAEDVEGKGIYLCEWEPSNAHGQPLGKTFRIYAAKRDTSGFRDDHISYDEATRKLARMGQQDGRKILKVFNEKGIVAKIADQTAYNGELFVPPMEIVKHGFLANRTLGALKGTTTDIRYHTSSKSTVRPWKNWIVVAANNVISEERISREERVKVGLRLVHAELKNG